MVLLSPVALSQPTVDGLFLSTGDDARYSFLQADTSGTAGRLHIAIDGNTVYIALEVDESASDTVCGGSNAYINSVNWQNGRNPCRKASDSEFALFGVECGAVAGTPDWEWQQSVAYPYDTVTMMELDPRTMTGPDQPNVEWRSDASGGAGLIVVNGTPPGYTAASSLAWNWENSNIVAGGGWDMAPGGGDVDTWQSPDVDGDNDVNEVVGDEWRPAGGQGYLLNGSGNAFWEWPLVYEWSFDASTCTGPLSITPGSSHNSPLKQSNDEDIPFDPFDLIDLGDAPDSYGTTAAAAGPNHQIVLGTSVIRLGGAIDAEGDGQPSADATADGTDEEGVASFSTLPGAGPGSMYTVAVTVTNTSGAAAELCGWVDFDLDGPPGDGTFESDEMACVQVPGAGGNAACTDLGGGVFSCNLVFTLPADFVQVLNEPTFARFRTGSVLTEVNTVTGAAVDGEVEDYLIPANTLPVSLNYFASRRVGSSIVAEWATVSESFNIGFDVLGKIGGDWVPLTPELVLSTSQDAVTPQQYRAQLDSAEVDLDSIEWLALASLETTGVYELYGEFSVGEEYGEAALPQPIPWRDVRDSYDARMLAKGYVQKDKKWRKNSSGNPVAAQESAYPAVEVEAAEPGVHRLTYRQLLDAGLDLKDVAKDRIAVTLKGQAVPRHVGGSGKKFGGHGYLDFWAELPGYPDALYVDKYVYRIEVDPDKAQDPAEIDYDVEAGTQSALQAVRVNEENAYHMFNALEDPWYATLLQDPWGPLSYDVEMDVDDALLSDQAGRIEVSVSGATTLPDDPDHHVQVLINGTLVDEATFDGVQSKQIVAEVPANLLRVGANDVSVRLGGGTGAAFDVVYVDRVTLWYPRQTVAVQNALLIEDVADEAQALTVSGLAKEEVVAYAHDDRGNLARLPSISGTNKKSKTDEVSVPRIAEVDETHQVSYWVSNVSALKTPEILGLHHRQDLLADPADYLIIADPSFVPDSAEQDHPLNLYVNHREQSWTVRILAIDDIQAQFGGGMPLPGAVTEFLEAADQAFVFSHVLLVGDDTYDYHDRLGNGSFSFVPTVYAGTSIVKHTPSDSSMMDLDGDGVPDKAFGRWTARTLVDLEVMVAKTLAWEDETQGPRNSRSALWVTDSEDAKQASFTERAERLLAKLPSSWPAANLDRVYFDQVTALPGLSVSATSRQQIIDAIEQGKTITGFSGHGSPTMWTFQGLLKPEHVSELDNVGKPTLISTLTCYTSYFVSPTMDTLAHRLMKGYKLNAAGEEMPGIANGAVAVDGASTLSNYYENEFLATVKQDAMLLDGATIGQATLEAIRQAAENGFSDVVINWALLGDPTLTIRQGE